MDIGALSIGSTIAHFLDYPPVNISKYHTAYCLCSAIEGNPLLRNDAFQNEHSRALFDAIEKLRSCNVDRVLELPQLIIVGDQSAGKSSLLQSLTDIPFPVANNLCTRFPTRIISRRDPGLQDTQTEVSIERKESSMFGHFLGVEPRHPSMDGFKRSFTTLTKADFARVIDDATDALGIFRAASAEENDIPPDTTQKRNFSDYELKIIISGPDRSHFSILDVPGIFHSPTRRVTELDRLCVDAMVSGYMKSPQSIVICVTSGTSDIPTQAIFKMVKTQDPEGVRTVGVITKCDVAEQRASKIIEAVNNQELPLRHGWFVVRNRTPSEVEEAIGPSERCRREQEFFDRDPWNQLPEERRGTEALKDYLAELLCDRIKKVFPTILNDIEIRRNSTALKLEALGEARPSVEQKLLDKGLKEPLDENGWITIPTYLTKIAHDFNQLATQGLRGRYDGVAGHDMRLRMKVRDANDQFASDMNKNGHFLAFDLGPSRLNAQADKVRPHCPGTQTIPFQAHIEKDVVGGRINNYFQSISAMGSYKDQSFEELRLSDYSQAQPPLFAKPIENSSGSIFGKPTESSSGSIMFGKPNENSSGSLFASSGSSFAKPTGKSSGSIFASLGSSSAKPVENSSGNVFKLGVNDQSQVGSTTPQSIKAKTTGPNGVLSSASNSPSTSGGNPTFQTEPTEIYKWIRKEIKSNRGTELQGTMNPDVLPILFHKQARQWRGIAESHFDHITTIADNATGQVLDAVCKDPLTKKKITSCIREVTARSKGRFLALLSQRVDHILSRHLQTNNPAFEQKVTEARKRRFRAALERYKSRKSDRAFVKAFLKTHGHDRSDVGSIPDDDEDPNRLIIDMRDVGALFAELHMSNSQNLEDEVHDTLKAYYEIARDDFIEYVNQLIVEPYLSDLEGPVLFFSPVYVAGLKDETINALGQEDENNRRERAVKEATLARLDQAEKIAREYDQG
ncbi:hypothetical protein JMJ35_007281 [Cladonia borealis]|uniref:Uncharacterized protein n=1 Tax=Cladonia borealis TaxID=184061 RepID=A0AA39QV98_9LECA|nr:hypothetical protein JMJ35_007281 [Cladonia borealis]